MSDSETGDAQKTCDVGLGRHPTNLGMQHGYDADATAERLMQLRARALEAAIRCRDPFEELPTTMQKANEFVAFLNGSAA